MIQQSRTTFPNFFLAGAPKCGTTALAEYLKSHPDVFFSDPKEPHYFCDDIRVPHRIESYDKYLAAFAGVGAKHLAVGEGSVYYLASESAIGNILAQSPEARFIAMVRNPVEIVHSLHAMYILGNIEDVSDLALAWQLQEARSLGKSLPRHCPDAAMLMYKQIASVGEQVERLLSQVPPERVKILVADDMKENPRQTYLEVLSFLDLNDDGRTSFPRINANKVARSKKLSQALHNVAINLKKMKSDLGFDKRFGLVKRLQALNSAEVKRRPLDDSFRQVLAQTFLADIEILSKCLNRDFTYWLRVEA